MSTDPLKSKRDEVYSTLLGRIPATEEFMEVKRAMQRRFLSNGKLSSVGMPENISFTIAAIQGASTQAELERVEVLVKNNAFKRLPKAELKSQLLRAKGGGGSGTGAVSGTGGSATGRRRAPSSSLEEDDCSKELQKLKEQLREVKERLLDVGGQLASESFNADEAKDGLDKCGKTVEKLQISIKNRDERYNVVWRKLNKVEAENQALREKASGAGSKVSGDMVPRKKHDDALERIIGLKDKNAQLEVKNRQLEAKNKALGKSVGEKVGRGITYDAIMEETKTGEILPQEGLASLEKELSDSQEKLKIARENLEEQQTARENQEQAHIDEIEVWEGSTGILVKQIDDAKDIIGERDKKIIELKSANRGIRQKLQEAKEKLALAQQETNTIYEQALEAGDQGEENNKLRIEIDALKDDLEQVNQALEECQDRYLFDDEYENDDFEPDDDLEYFSDADDRSSARRRLEYPEDSSEDEDGYSSEEYQQRLDNLGIVDSDDGSEDTTPAEKKTASGGGLYNTVTNFFSGGSSKNPIQVNDGDSPSPIDFDDVEIGDYITNKKQFWKIGRKNENGDRWQGANVTKEDKDGYKSSLKKEDFEKGLYFLSSKEELETHRRGVATINRRTGRSSRRDSAGAGSGPTTRSQTRDMRQGLLEQPLRVVSYEGVAGEVPALPLLRIPEPHEL